MSLYRLSNVENATSVARRRMMQARSDSLSECSWLEVGVDGAYLVVDDGSEQLETLDIEIILFPSLQLCQTSHLALRDPVRVGRGDAVRVGRGFDYSQ